ncbi:hypothetical protein KEM48_001362 [Puccinia striiformis f. sp. tritici PST-130]|nr:hypothetical protein KEM48_001362 [Puccinia striiformis f. sp. tritici PST-130]
MNSYHRCSSGEAWMLRADTKPPPLPPGTNIAVSRFDLLFQKQLSGLKSAVKRFITSGPSQPSASLTKIKTLPVTTTQEKSKSRSKRPLNSATVLKFRNSSFFFFTHALALKTNSLPQKSIKNFKKITSQYLKAPSTASPRRNLQKNSLSCFYSF